MKLNKPKKWRKSKLKMLMRMDAIQVKNLIKILVILKHYQKNTITKYLNKNNIKILKDMCIAVLYILAVIGFIGTLKYLLITPFIK